MNKHGKRYKLRYKRSDETYETEFTFSAKDNLSAIQQAVEEVTDYSIAHIDWLICIDTGEKLLSEIDNT